MQHIIKYTNRIVSVFMSLVVTTLCMHFPMKSSGSDEPDLKEMAEQLIVLVNEAREEEGLKPLYAVPYLCDMSYVRARECISVFSHERPDGSMFIDLVDYSLVPWKLSAENIAAGMDTPEATFNQWKNSPKHWSTIMSPDYTHIGVGVAYEPNSDYEWYWEQMFVSVDESVRPSGELEGQYFPSKYKIVPESAGDLNGDGVIDSFDYVLLKQYLAKEVTFNPLQVESADLLPDGAITYSDAACLRNYILGKIDKLPLGLLDY